MVNFIFQFFILFSSRQIHKWLCVLYKPCCIFTVTRGNCKVSLLFFCMHLCWSVSFCHSFNKAVDIRLCPRCGPLCDLVQEYAVDHIEFMLPLVSRRSLDIVYGHRMFAYGYAVQGGVFCKCTLRRDVIPISLLVGSLVLKWSVRPLLSVCRLAGCCRCSECSSAWLWWSYPAGTTPSSRCSSPLPSTNTSSSKGRRYVMLLIFSLTKDAVVRFLLSALGVKLTHFKPNV